MSDKKENLSYESALEELESIQRKLESEEVPIDQLSQLAKRAKFLVQWCKEKLKDIDKELSEIFVEDQ
ncbi:exodeoxyribonuclease VII small subunit [Flammeovirga sp. EKP202]|uniref:exodeoxyribonuclease VII small subunit n=1 Tax=Flammeovirga sp. EKP202 TaxID=2770592 RepID=UPI00165EFC15|nr:exodeoxyribonuclease VII small subunit [Flammeovirga sp. EKP202]MBD0402128.1 exodeoxyribonuclease VII small subunit [Flammeovirga sp. EKP202]